MGSHEELKDFIRPLLDLLKEGHDDFCIVLALDGLEDILKVRGECFTSIPFFSKFSI